MPGMMCMPMPVPSASSSSTAATTTPSTATSECPTPLSMGTPSTTSIQTNSNHGGVPKSALPSASSQGNLASSSDDRTKGIATTETVTGDVKAKGSTKTPIMPSMMNILPSPQPMMMMGGMMPGMLPPPFMAPMPGMMTSPFMKMGQPGHMYQPPSNQTPV